MKLKWLWWGIGVVVGLPLLIALAALVTYQVLDRRCGALEVDGETREYLLYVPDTYDGTEPVPLVISMHGTSLWPASQMATSRWNKIADEESFLVVYPAAVPLWAGGFPRIWRAWPGIAGRSGMDGDVQFISELIDHLASRFEIDPARIYANGFSSGGGMANLLACRLPGRIAAVGTVATAHLSWDECQNFRPIPLIAIHGTADQQVPYEGGASWMTGGDMWDSIAVWTESWAQRNGCDSVPEEFAIASDVTRREFDNCGSDAEVVLLSVSGGGHAWPGSDPAPEWMVGYTTDSIDATREIWTFFTSTDE